MGLGGGGYHIYIYIDGSTSFSKWWFSESILNITECSEKMLILWLQKNCHFFHKSKTIPKSFMTFLKNKRIKQLASKTNLAVLKVVTPTRLDHTKYSFSLTRSHLPPLTGPPAMSKYFKTSFPFGLDDRHQSTDCFFQQKKAAPQKKQTNISCFPCGGESNHIGKYRVI